jgi:hypothetical protein
VKQNLRVMYDKINVLTVYRRNDGRTSMTIVTIERRRALLLSKVCNLPRTDDVLTPQRAACRLCLHAMHLEILRKMILRYDDLRI